MPGGITMNEKMNNMKILVTGASGFIGSFIVEEGLRRGYSVWAAVRPSSSRRYLKDKNIQLVEFDLEHPEVLRVQLAACRARMGAWDVVVHAAGATKCVRREDFFRTNTEGTRHLVEGLRQAGMMPGKFVFISSLSVYGAIRENPVRKSSPDCPWVYAPIREEDTPHPNTAYGESKLEAECYLKQQSDLPYVILRPTGVYGPRERDYFMMAKSIRQHSDFTVGYKPQEITFVYVRDLVQAVFLAAEKNEICRREYFITDGEVYHSETFSDLIAAELGHPFFVRIKAPVWLLRLVCTVAGAWSAWQGRTVTLNRDKFHILKQRNWQCDIEPARRELGYRPRYSLAEGVRETITWYKKEGWL